MCSLSSSFIPVPVSDTSTVTYRVHPSTLPSKHPPASFGRELEGIGQQVHHHLAHFIFIKQHVQRLHSRIKGQMYILLLRKHQERCANMPYESHYIPFGRSEMQPRHFTLAKSSNWFTRFNSRSALRCINVKRPNCLSSDTSFIMLSSGDIISIYSRILYSF